MSQNMISPIKLVDYLTKVVRFESIIILGYQNGSHPVCLFNSLHSEYEQSMLDILNSSYSFDPFYSTFSNNKLEGVYKLEDVITDKCKFKEYRKQFHADTKRFYEVAISVQLDPRRRVAIFVRRSSEFDPFSPKDKLVLQKHFSKLKTQCRKLWPHIWTTTAKTSDNQIVNAIHQSLDAFGAEILTGREQEIATLIIQGSDNKEISSTLEISIATVKAHRKNIYSKLEISSLGEMFQLFLNHLILRSSQETIYKQDAA
ncbi:LuxR C-terminal-related transcriptional regulator [Vibrio sp. HN007]|uniref:response regulator transcription factor n=1 Tax=Vibrio iocasae TaxID=3098914 RepID=UPI0035D42188